MKRLFYLLMKTLVATTMAVFVTNDLFAQENNCGAPYRLQVLESNESAILTWSDRCFYEYGFIGFNLYRNGEQIGEKSFRNVRYTDSEVELNTRYEYVLEAFYDDGCSASDTVEITLTGQGTPLPPAMLQCNPVKNADSAYDVTLSWNLPYFEEPMVYGYCGVPAGTNYIGDASQIFCVVGWDKNDMDKFDEDLYLVGVEFVLGMDCFSKALRALNTVVYVDGELVYNEPFEERFLSLEWIRAYFDQAFKMKQAQEIAVGYMVSYDPNAMRNEDGVLVYDMGPGTNGKSDLISGDGVNFGSLKVMFGVDANLCINALVVRQRDLEEAVMASDPQAYLQRKAMRVDASKTSSTEVKLLGFNVYRDMVRLNDTLIRELTFVDRNLICRGQDKECEYEYRVSAIYEGGREEYSDYYVLVSGCDPLVPKAVPTPVVSVMVKRGEDVLLRGEDAQTAIYYGIGENARPTIPYTGGILINEPTILRAMSVVGKDTSDIITLDCKVFDPEEQEIPSLNETNGLAGVNIYPNPTNGEFSIDVPVDVTIDFYDAGGKLFARNQVGAGLHTYTLHDSGVYMIRATAQDGRTTTRRIIVK